MKNKIVSCFLGLAVCIVTSLFVGASAMAAIPEEATEKFMREAVRQCYLNNEMEAEIITKGGTVEEDQVAKVSDAYYLPNGNAFGITRTTCRELLFGNNNGWNGVLSVYAGQNVDLNDPASVKNLLENYLQYKSDTTGSMRRKCFTIRMTAVVGLESSGQVSSVPMCIGVDEAGIIQENEFRQKSGQVSSGQGINVYSQKGKIYIHFALGTNSEGRILENEVGPIKFKVGESWFGDFIPRVRRAIEDGMNDGILCTHVGVGGCDTGYLFESARGDGVDGNETIEVEDAPAVYVLEGNLATLGQNALSKIFNGQIRTILKVSTAINLYQDYVNDAISNGYLTVTCGLSEQEMQSFGTPFMMIKDGAKTQCMARVINNTAKYNVLNASMTPDVMHAPVGIEEVLKKLTDVVNASNLSSNKLNEISGIIANEATDYGELTTGEMCYDSGIEGSSWILCPTMENMEYTASSLDNAIEDWLSVNSNIYGRNSGTYTAWGLVRDIANIVIIVILIVVVISQLTGYGIDNYGIKRILPRLIMMAVLLNLSFYICELAIDLSNILGVGLRDLFGNAGKMILNGKSDSNFINEVIKALFVAGGLASASIPTIITGVTAVSALGVGSTIMVAVIILLSLLVVLIGIFMFFFSLGARTIIIIFCVAVAPLAFVAYVLPNTQRMFKQWWSLFKAALIIFPICGALGGVSYMIKAIVLQTNNPPFSLLVVALISPYIVFFLLPALIRGAISSFGRIGAALTSLGGAFRGGVQSTAKAVQGTAGYKSTMQEGQMAMMRRSVGLGADGKLTERGRKILAKAQEKGGGRLRLYSARMAAIQKDQDAMASGAAALRNLAQKNTEITDEQAATATTIFGNKFGGQREAFFANDFIAAAQHARETNDTSQLDSVVAAMTQSGMESKDIAWMLRTGEHRGLLDLGDRQAKANWAQGIAQKYGNSFLKKDPELRHNYGSGNRIALTRRTDAQGVARNVEDTYGDYAGGWTNVNADGNVLLGENGMPRNMVMDSTDINQDEIIDMSSDAIAGAISAGTIDRASARRVLATNRVQTGDKKFMLEAVASGLVGRGVNVSEFKQDAKALANAAPGSYASMAKSMRVIGTAASGGNASMNDSQFGTWAEAAASPVAQTVRIIEGDVDLRGGRNGNGGNAGGNGAHSNSPFE
ncbi:hypothetical protein IJJ39_00165 [Candidatus Saccharibacteria bacterium]|nr:hypothetical protein [Candidatus Saccharibacteria bacterium]